MSAGESNRYHHGALREALLAAAEKLLRRDGLAALTLRAIAREAGVSHGAPAHHFNDLAGLLSDLAARGFQRLAGQLEDAVGARGMLSFPVPKTYVRFAIENQELFSLMFREERLDAGWPALREARRAAFASLARILEARDEAPGLRELGRMTAAWSMAHGFAVLAIDGRLAPVLRAAPDGVDLDALLDAAFASVNFRVAPGSGRTTRRSRFPKKNGPLHKPEQS